MEGTTNNSTGSSTPSTTGTEDFTTVAAVVVGVAACAVLIGIVVACYFIKKKRKPPSLPIDNTTTVYRKDSLFTEEDNNGVIARTPYHIANEADNSGFYRKELPKKVRIASKQSLSGHVYKGEDGTEFSKDVTASPFNKTLEMTEKEKEEEATFTY